MPTKPLPINVGLGAALEETTSPALYRADAVNVYFDLAGNVIPRPGISAFCTIGTGSSAGIRGLYWWEYMQVLLVVYNTNIYRVDENGTVTTIASSVFEATGYTSFAEFNDVVYAANGGEIIKIQYSSAAAVADGDAPTSVEGVVEMDGYLLAHDGLGCHVYYSDANAPDSWSGDWISPAQTFGEIKAIGVKNNILEIVGDTGWEGWRNDGVTPFVRDEQYTVDAGIVTASHSFRHIAGTWYFINRDNKLSRLNGRAVERLSIGLDRLIEFYAPFSAAVDVGCDLSIASSPFYTLYLPGGEKTFLYDIQNNKFTEIGWHNTGTVYDEIKIRSTVYSRLWGKQFIGIDASGILGVLSSTTYQDYGTYDLAPFIRTPQVHWNAPHLDKKSSRLDFYFKKTEEATISSAPTMTVRWRDNGSTTWKTTHTITLDNVNGTDYRGYFNRCGMYKTRQYEIALPEGAPLALVSAMETFRVIGGEDG